MPVGVGRPIATSEPVASVSAPPVTIPARGAAKSPALDGGAGEGGAGAAGVTGAGGGGGGIRYETLPVSTCPPVSATSEYVPLAGTGT